MTMNKTMPDLIPVEAVAKELGTTAVSVMMHIKRRLLEGLEIEGKWYIREESLAQFRLRGAERHGVTLCSRHCPSRSGCGTCA